MPTIQPVDVPSDLSVHGNLNALGGFIAPAGCIGNTNFNGSDPLQTTNQKHRIQRGYGQASGSGATTERRFFYRAQAAGTLYAVRAGVIVPAVAPDTVTVDLKKNGSSVLSAVITVDNTVAAYLTAAGTITSAAYVAGDCFDVTITANHTSGTLPQGVFVEAVFENEGP